tara:strand:+ start:226 stop:1134 length:909 start_codon:yes stop_codon:yes gene_type:complete
MAYLGNAPARSFISFEKQVFTIVNSQTAYTLSHSVNNENDIRLVINNIVQEPGSGKAYTASGTTLTLSAALTNGTDEMYCVFLGRATATNAPGSGSVGTSQLASDAVTEAKIADDAVESEHLNNNVISGQTALGAEPADTDEFLVSDAGTIKRVDYSYIKAGTMTPAFFAEKNSTQSITNNSFTKITYETEIVDTDSAFASSKFTVPSGKAGKYFIGFNKMNNKGGVTAEDYTTIYKNGSSFASFPSFSGNQTQLRNHNIIMDLAAADYLEVYHYGTTTDSSAASLLDGERNSFYGYKIIGA